MRDILFRGKRKDSGEWVYGGLHIEIGETDKDGNQKYDYRILGLRGECYYVISETVGQYIGLSDKNGDKIFEGDILNGFEYPFLDDEGNHNYYAEVCWFSNSPAFGICTVKNPNSKVRGVSDGTSDYIEDFKSELWEIIGNIYDNSKLLKEA